jgi:hypothetical protein
MRNQVALTRTLARQDKTMQWETLSDGAKGLASSGDSLTVTLIAPGQWQAVRVASGETYTAVAVAPLLAVLKTSVAALEAADRVP